MFGRNRQPEPVVYEWTLEFIDAVPVLAEDGSWRREREIRRIVREELADLVPVDVPDAPPKDLS